MIKDTLKRLGLTNNEIELYLVLLSSPELSVNKLAQNSGLHRQVCYDALDRLLEKGFVSYVQSNNKKYFKALKPDRILDFLDEQKEEVKTILPQLSNLFANKTEETEIDVIKGENVFRTIFLDIIKVAGKAKGEVCVSGLDESKLDSKDLKFMQDYDHKLKRTGIKERVITSDKRKSFVGSSQVSYALIPDELSDPGSIIYTYSDRVVTVIIGRPKIAIIIKNKGFAESNKKYFDLIWKSAKKLNKSEIIEYLYKID